VKVQEIKVVDLSNERCVDCRPGTPTLAPEVARELAAGLHHDWALSDVSIERTFTFKSFNAAFGLATRVALLADPTPIQKGPAGSEDSALHASDGWTRFVLERRLGVGVDQLSDRDIQAGKLATGGYTAFVVPDDQIPALALGGTSLTAIQTFVRSGGTFVGVRNGGLAVARAAALTTVSDQTPSSGYQVPGATFDVLVDQADPVAWGFGPQAWIFNAADPVFSATAGAVTYPAGGGIVSGYASGAGALRGTAALIDAPLGAGRVVLFAFDPRRTAILLIGGDKQGQWQRWYREFIPVADRLYDEHLAELADEGDTT